MKYIVKWSNKRININLEKRMDMAFCVFFHSKRHIHYLSQVTVEYFTPLDYANKCDVPIINQFFKEKQELYSY